MPTKEQLVDALLPIEDPETERTFSVLAERISAWLGTYAEKRVFVSIGARPR
jgi:hypothetical protein